VFLIHFAKVIKKIGQSSFFVCRSILELSYQRTLKIPTKRSIFGLDQKNEP